jgi:hypothetical protein
MSHNRSFIGSVKVRRSFLRQGAPLAAFAVALAASSGACSAGEKAKAPMMIDRQGSYEIGGKVLGDSKNSLSCDHGFMEYQIPHNPRATSLVMWHSSSTKVWQTRWDDGEGYQSIFLRRGYPVYLWDGPRVGRANWSCEPITYKPSIGQDQRNFIAWRFGESYPNWFPGVQFPTKDPAAWEQATRARYDEFDTVPNVQLETDAAAPAMDKIGPVVLVTNSAGGFRAIVTAIKTKTDNVKAIVAYENPGFVFPEGEGPEMKPDGPFGPIAVPLADFKKLTKMPMQFVWGDNVEKSPSWTAWVKICEQFVATVNKHGGKAEILHLPSVGLKGNTHIPFADLNNVQVADQLSLFLKKNGLDGAASKKAGNSR